MLVPKRAIERHVHERSNGQRTCKLRLTQHCWAAPEEVFRSAVSWRLCLRKSQELCNNETFHVCKYIPIQQTNYVISDGVF